MEPFIVGIRFQKIGKVYHFDASEQRTLLPGDFVVVETSRGKQIGEIIQTFVSPPPAPPEGAWKPVERLATPRDLVMRQMWGKKELEATINSRAKLAELGVDGVKIIGSEFSFDGSRLAILYSSESGDKQDLNKLRNALQRMYTRTHLEIRQIGPRDVAKILGGMGACGLETRCCSMFLTEFSPVSIKMAKEQGISLTPSEITGMCGRLRCCLVYEYEQYVEARKTLPKRGKRVITPVGEGKVIDVFPLKQSVMVEISPESRHEYMKHELQPWDELEALRRKAEGPCDRHENGGCDCGKAASEGKPARARQATEIDPLLQSEIEEELNETIGYGQDEKSDFKADTDESYQSPSNRQPGDRSELKDRRKDRSHWNRGEKPKGPSTPPAGGPSTQDSKPHSERNKFKKNRKDRRYHGEGE